MRLGQPRLYTQKVRLFGVPLYCVILLPILCRYYTICNYYFKVDDMLLGQLWRNHRLWSLHVHSVRNFHGRTKVKENPC